jgi:hypothetical protein
MKKEKMIADELQCMFLEEKLLGFNEKYINTITRKLRTGELTIYELVQEDSDLKEKVLEALKRLLIIK